MTRAFKKRLLALVLTLALCTALMLPGFAAVKDTPTVPCESEVEMQENACSHVWIYTDSPTFVYVGGERTLAYHDLHRLRHYECTKCHYTYSVQIAVRRESHQVPCSVCGFVHS